MAVTSGIIMATSAITSSYAQSQALKSKADYEEMQARANAKLSDIQANEAMKKGDLNAAAARRKGAEVTGAQRAASAGQGIQIDYGSSLDLQNETTKMSEIDAMTAHNNAWREAWGFRVQAINSTNSAAFQSSADRYEAKSTLLTGGLQAIGYGANAGYDYKQSKAPNNKAQPSYGNSPSEYSSSWPGKETKSKYYGVKY